MNFVQVVLSLFTTVKSDQGMRKREGIQPAKNERTARVQSKVLAEVLAKLDAAAGLLTAPTPKAIHEAGSILEEAHVWLRREQPSDSRALVTDIAEVQQGMRKVRRLLEGALQVQWIQIRQAAAVTQVYMPGGRIAASARAVSQVDVNA